VACSHIPGKTYGEKGRSRARNLEKGSVRFSILAPEAERVLLVLMRTPVPAPETYEVQAGRGARGVWTASVDLIPGEYRFFFIVDGSITMKGVAGRVEQDDFGGSTGVLTVYPTPEGDLRSF